MAKGLKEIVTEAKSRIREIDAAAAAELLGKGDGVLFLDLREPEECQAGRIPGALRIPRGVLESRAAADSPARAPELADPARPIVAYCASGVRSALAADVLQVLGFTDVRSLAGGFGGWVQAGNPVET